MSKFILCTDVVYKALGGQKRCLDENIPVGKFCSLFNWYAADFNISENNRRALFFLANVIIESNCLKKTEENMNYSAKRLLQVWPNRFDIEKAELYAGNPVALANYVYADRMGNGSFWSGDGWRYRGRGYMMLTGKENYSKFLKFVDALYHSPIAADDVSKPPMAMVSAMWFWSHNRLNEMCDRNDFGEIVRRITGSMNDFGRRVGMYNKLNQIMEQ